MQSPGAAVWTNFFWSHRGFVDPANQLKRWHGEFDGESFVRLVTRADRPGEDECAAQKIQQQGFASLLKFTLPSRARDPQPGKPTLQNSQSEARGRIGKQ